jgi:hypothetical protein
MRLAGQVALITGASRGIGRAIAMELAREGADVAVNYRKQAATAEETAAEIRALGRRAVIVHADISDAAACLRMAGAAEAALGPLDVVVANGGVASRPSLVADLPVEEMASRARHRSQRMLLHDQGGDRRHARPRAGRHPDDLVDWRRSLRAPGRARARHVRHGGAHGQVALDDAEISRRRAACSRV